MRHASDPVVSRRSGSIASQITKAHSLAEQLGGVLELALETAAYPPLRFTPHESLSAAREGIGATAGPVVGHELLTDILVESGSDPAYGRETLMPRASFRRLVAIRDQAEAADRSVATADQPEGWSNSRARIVDGECPRSDRASAISSTKLPGPQMNTSGLSAAGQVRARSRSWSMRPRGPFQSLVQVRVKTSSTSTSSNAASRASSSRYST